MGMAAKVNNENDIRLLKSDINSGEIKASIFSTVKKSTCLTITSTR